MALVLVRAGRFGLVLGGEIRTLAAWLARMRFPFPVLLLSTCGFAAEFDDAPVANLTAGIQVTLETAANLRGGTKTGEIAQALTLAHVFWERPASPVSPFAYRAYVSALNHSGSGPTERLLGDFLAASNIEAYSSTRVYSWWGEAAHDRSSFRLGALLADEEFAGTDAGGQLINSSFGWPAFISANTVNTGPAFYVATLGARFEHRLSANLVGRVGVYDGDSFDSPTGDPAVARHGLHYRLGGEQGWFGIAELAWTPAGGANRWKLGAWHHTAPFADQNLDDAGRPFALSGKSPRDHSGNSGAYVILERSLTGRPGEPGQVDFFARLGGAPSDRNTLSWAVDTGVAITGALPSRPADVLALGFAHAEFSSRLAATARLLDPAAPPLDAEQVVEASYTFAVSDHVLCKPDLQFVRHPGGSGALGDALLFTFRVVAEF